MCSALGQEAKVLEAIKAGAKDFVVKPCQPVRSWTQLKLFLNKISDSEQVSRLPA